ncbi:site-specific integrase [Pseudomonas marincola]|nr:site-specific integrase [Pseudomonas marincola]
MTLSKDILKALAVFHLDQPEATWTDLKERLLDVAKDTLSQSHADDGSLSAYDMIYGDLAVSLAEASAKANLSVDQHKALAIGRRIIGAAQDRLHGDPKALVEIIEELEGQSCSTPVALNQPLSVLPVGEPLTFKTLSELFLAERKGNVTDSTLKAVQSNCSTLFKLIGDLDMRTHTRADMVALKAKVVEGRKPLTINKLLAQLSTVMDWAKNNGHIQHSYDKGLKIERGAESTRKPLSRDQVVTIMDHANNLPVDDWKRWALSLGVLTGARIGEIYQLNKEDIKQVEGITVIDINKDENGGKTLKNNFSVRQVPLVDGAYGFSLEVFLEWVAANEGRLFKAKEHYFNKPLNEALREPLGLKAGGNQSFHSLRHSLAGLLKAAATPDIIAQGITGHSSGNITYDLYGGSGRVAVSVLNEALKKAFGLVA